MAARQASLDFIISESLLKLRSVESVMPCTLTLTVSSSVSLFYCLQSFLASEKRESIKAILVSPCPWRGGALALLGVPSFLSGGGSLTGASVPTGRSLEAREHSGVGDLRKFRGGCAARPSPRAPPPISPCWAPLTQVPRLTPLSPATRSRPSFPRLKDGFDEVKGGPKSPGRKED